MRVGDVVLDDTLQHYGVLGMKWGVRRSDAQLAAAANRKQQAHDAKIKRQKDKLELREYKAKIKTDEVNARAKDAATKKATKESNAKIKAEQAKLKMEQDQARVKAKMEVSKESKKTDVKFKSSDFKHMSDDELRAVLNRMNMEEQFRKLNPEPPSKSKQIMNTVGGVAVTTQGIINAMGGTQAVYSMITKQKPSSGMKPSKDMTTQEMEDLIRRSNVVKQYNALRKEQTPNNATAAALDQALAFAAMMSKKK